MHQWDGQEDHTHKKPYRACLENCMCQGQFIHGRLSSMIIYKALHERRDRKAVPMPFGNRGGLLLNPTKVQFDCLYGIDGATYHLDRAALPGCSSTFCDASAESVDYGGGCGFQGEPATAWAPKDMKLLLQKHKDHGYRYHAPGWHSGYNEAVFNARAHNARLPHSVAAFFVLKGESAVTVIGKNGYGSHIDVVQAHGDFLRTYGISASQVPLLQFDAHNWVEPFSVYSPLESSRTRACLVAARGIRLYECDGRVIGSREEDVMRAKSKAHG